ncbi:hypothetical protein A1O1_01658 [Capronia coronata CBS 617.96]|uniref:SnoaL-like domain-containing protein n=1 Tax=Capronia coronata CBS 617.96 TaxID=1182541 RepID=W9YVG7_9EURO|nr:uncharacterized protein A1O1_01658 [Capronia coronata CBS 617.96]EXJ93266.1 hypothetical protein A1O1_01658 [Capronia coronata CBS 617.96]
MVDAQALADGVIGAFNEPDAQIRARQIRCLWTPTGQHFGGFVAKGYPDLEVGIQGSHDNIVIKNGWKWRAYNAQVKENIVFFMFDGVSQEGKVEAFGSYVLELADDGSIEKDYTFVLQSRYAPDDI